MTTILQVALLLFAGRACGFIMPMTNSSGHVDLTRLVSHVTLMEKTIKDLEIQVTASNSQLGTIQAKLHSTDDELNAVAAELRITGDELYDVKTNLAKKDVEILELNTRLMAAESDIFNVTNDVLSRPSGSELTGMMSDIAEIKKHVKAPQSGLNVTVIDRIGADVKANVMAIQTLRSSAKAAAMDINSTRLEVQQLQGNNSARVQNLQVDVELLRSLVQSNISAMTNDVGHIRHELLQHIDLSNEIVAFYVTELQNEKNVSKDPIQNFDHVELNEGQGYNETSGYFTAPFSGTYLFWINVVFQNSIGEVDIVKEGNVIAAAYADPPKSDNVNLDTASAVALNYVNAGEKVTFNIKSPGAFLQGGRRAHYGGVMLHWR